MNSLLNLAPGDRLSVTAVLLVAVSALGMAGCAQEEPEHDMSSMAMDDMDMEAIWTWKACPMTITK